MSLKDDSVFVEHVLESIGDVEDFTRGVKKGDFLKNKEKQNAVIRSLEVIGEAVKNMSGAIKERHEDVRWREISGTRDKMIHHYFGVDLGVVWEIVKIGLPELKRQMIGIRGTLRH